MHVDVVMTERHKSKISFFFFFSFYSGALYLLGTLCFEKPHGPLSRDVKGAVVSRKLELLEKIRHDDKFASHHHPDAI